MECNREEAEECIRIAAQALREFKAQRAKNFLNKAERLYPSQQAKDLLEQVREFDKEQEVYRIQRCQTHYEVLEVPRNAKVKDIEAAYKKLALLVHPDKNRAQIRTEANAAFVKLQEAKRVLTTLVEKIFYDLNVREEAAHQPNENDDPPEFEDDDEDDEEDYSQNEHPFPRPPNWWERKNGQLILMLLPLILLVLVPAAIWVLMWLFPSISLFTPLSLSKPYSIYSLTHEGNYRIRRRTLAGKIPYYVSENYAAELRDFYQGSLARLEREVKLAYACKREEEERKSELENAENSPYKDSPNWHDWYSRAKSMETPSCAKLELLTKNDYSSNILNYFLIPAKFLFS